MNRAAILLSMSVAAPAFATGIGPSPYLSSADSPLAGPAYTYFHLENFEDGVLNTPGVVLSAGLTTIAGPGPQTDSVDGDDGVIDGSGVAGRSLLALQTNSFRFDFDAMLLGGLPTHAGVVWTDVGRTNLTVGSGLVQFRAFDSASMEVASIDAVLGDGDTFGATAEDRFFGAENPAGIAYITISMPDSVDWEIDHLQYGLIPSPGAAAVIGLILPALTRRRRD